MAWIDAEAKRRLKRREALCAQLIKYKDLSKALQPEGIRALYLNAQMDPGLSAAPPDGGKAHLHRLAREIDVLERLLVRYRG